MKKVNFKRIDHVSLTTGDLDATVDFYTRVLGAEVAYSMGPFDSAEIPLMPDGRDWTAAHINVPGARLRIVMLKLPGGLGMEIHAYEKPFDRTQQPPRNNDVGARHLCLEVDDIDAAIELLEKNGCKAMVGSIDMMDGPCPPSRSWYVLDPFGNQLELVQYH